MKKAYYLKTCDTCKRILNEVNTNGFDIQEIKTNPVTENQLQEMYALKRPVFIVDDLIFVGNSKKNIDALKEKVN
jgi:arsenate reductase